MIKTKKSKKKRIGLILCSLFICLCSILCIVPFNQEEKYVSADSIEGNGFSFQGSYLDMHYSSEDASIIPTNIIYDMQLSYRFTSDANNILTSFGYSAKIPIWKSISSTYVFDRSLPSDRLNSSTFTITSSSVSGFGYVWSSLLGGNESEIFRIYVSTFNDDGLIVMGKPIRFSLQCLSGWGAMCTNICYYDADGNSINIFHLFTSISDSSSLYNNQYYFLPYRVYYLTIPNLTDNEYYNQGYQQGQQNGYNTGYNVGQTAGYNEGYSVGQTTGYNNGYSDGMEDSNQYTFLNLLSATIDAPVKYFQSLFNFELLGVNLQGFLTGLFTLCVIVTIVKLCLGG